MELNVELKTFFIFFKRLSVSQASINSRYNFKVNWNS